jgi:RNA polymerase sigma-70 factor (ECF subfamily)
MQDSSLLFYMDGLHSYAMILSRNPAEAADLVQETYVRALRARESLRDGSNVKGWLFTILRNIWFNQLRKKQTTPAIIAIDTDEWGANIVVETAKGPHSLYVSKLEREQVREAIQRLPFSLREIIILREYEELSYQEIASLLECPVGTVMSRLARARSKLRSLLSATWQIPTSQKQMPHKPFSKEHSTNRSLLAMKDIPPAGCLLGYRPSGTSSRALGTTVSSAPELPKRGW